MIVVVCLNPALDVTHHVDAVDWGGVNRPRAVRARPGGKGLNVARTLHALGVDVLVLGLAGGITGAGVEAALRERCVPAAFTPVAGETRRTFSVVDGSVAGHGVTAFHEAGPEVGEEELARFRRGYEQALEGATAVVLSGSLPPGLEAGTYATLIETAAAAGVPAVLDTHGEALRRGAAAGPAIVKPNLAELAALAGRPLAPAAGGPADGAADGGRGPGHGGGRGGPAARGAGRGDHARPGRAAGRDRGRLLAGPAARRGGRQRDRRGRRGGRGPGPRARPRPAVGRAAAARGGAGRRDRGGPGRRGVPPPGLPRRAERGHGGGGSLMPLATMGEIIGPARTAGRGVGAFNVIGIEHAEAIVTGAETAGAPVVLQISENCAAWHGALEPIARACVAVARAAAVPVAVHLDHASGAELVRVASALGLGSVMYDASGLPYDENVRATAEVAAWCHDRGVWVEAELGEIGGKDGVHSPVARTDPDQAAGFVAATGVDALAVAVGSSHAMLTPDAVLDSRPDRQAPPGRRRPARAARLVGRAGSGPGRRGQGRPDEDQHRDPAEQGVHRGGQELPIRRARGG